MIPVLLLTLTFALIESVLFPEAGNKFVSEENRALYYVGENITLHCYANTPTTGVCFTYGSDFDVPANYVTRLNATYARMDKPVEDGDFDLTFYTCWSDHNKRKFIGRLSIWTEYRPRNVTKLSCKRLETGAVQCTWTLDGKYKNPCTPDSRCLTYITADWKPVADKENSWRACNSSSTTSCEMGNHGNTMVALRVNVTNAKRQHSAISVHQIPVL